MFMIVGGLIDLLCAIALGLLVVGYPLPTIHAAGALLLIGKGLFYYGDILSVIDIIIGVTMFVLLWTSMPLVALSFAIYLGAKAIYSFV